MGYGPYQYEDDFDRLKRENEEKKKKLKSEHIANFFTPDSGDEIDPLIENIFLNNIEVFENAYNSSKRVKIYDFIGRPQFRNVVEISESEISQELEKVMILLNEHQIELSTLCDVNDRELYRFITDELFEAETNDVKVEGMMSCFIYEEFHPNHDYEFRRICYDFMNDFIKRESKFLEYTLTKEALNDKILINFINSFITFELIKQNIEDVSIDSDNARVLLKISFIGTIEGSVEKQNYSGPIILTLIPEYGYWSINKVDISQLVII